MKYQVKICLLGALSLLCGMSLGACSSKPEVVQENRVEMITDYPKTAGPVLKNLAHIIPKNVVMMGYTSYGTITDLIPQAESFGQINHDELQSILKDLGTHYLINPSKLRDYYQAGFNTGSGFAVGYCDGNLFFAFDILDETLFKKWLENFINEEFGRPVRQETIENDRTFIGYNVLHKDFGTLVMGKEHTALFVVGQQLFPNSHLSIESAKSMIKQGTMAESAIDSIIAHSGESQVSFWASTQISQWGQLSENLVTSIRAWIDSANLNVSIQNNIPRFQVVFKYGETPYLEKKRGAWISDIFRGTQGTYDSQIIHDNDPLTMRISANLKTLEPLILPYLDTQIQDKYKSVKDKLTQRLLKIDIGRQIIYNLDSVWLSLHSGDDEGLADESGKSLLEKVLSKSVALYIPFRNHTESDGFFGKLNMLKKFIPENKASVQEKDGMLEADISMGGSKLHAAYKSGLLGLATDQAWPVLKSSYDNQSTVVPPFNKTGSFLVLHLDTEKLSSWIHLIDPQYGDMLKSLSAYIKKLDISASADESQVTVDFDF